MPRGTVTFGRRAGRLTVHAVMTGLTPGSEHGVHLLLPGAHAGVIRFSPLPASTAGRARATLHSHFRGPLPRGSRLVIRMGTGDGRVARKAIARTRRLRRGGPGPHRLIAVEIGRGGANWGTPRGRATISYDAQRRTLTVTVHASGLTPGPHAAHIHLGSCQSQGPVKYMLADLVANRHGRIAHAVRVFTHVTAPIPAHGWYLNIHQGNSGDILRNGQPTILFRPLLCANIRGSGSISSILRAGDITTGVRGTGNGHDVVLTGSAATGNGAQAEPFLYRGSLAKAPGAAVSVRKPPFRGVTSATFYGPDTHRFNPGRIPAGQVRAVGSYQSSAAPAGVINQGMIYVGPVSGHGGSWRSIDVPAHGGHTTGHVRACPRRRPHCFVMDTIAHSTMGNLVVGNYDLKPTAGPAWSRAMPSSTTWPPVGGPCYAWAAACPARPRSTGSGRTAVRAARTTRWPAARPPAGTSGRSSWTTTRGPGASACRGTTATATGRRRTRTSRALPRFPVASTSWA